MGACVTISNGESPENHRTHKAIERNLKETYVNENAINKLLLLGSGATGKSTLFRHWSLVLENSDFKKNYTNEDMVSWIRQSCLQSMHKLLQKTTQIHEFNKSQYESDIYGPDPNFGNKPFYINVHSLRDIQKKCFAKFKKNLFTVIGYYIKMNISSQKNLSKLTKNKTKNKNKNKNKINNSNTVYSNKKSKSIRIPDPSLWNNSMFIDIIDHDATKLSLNPFVIKSLISHKTIDNLNKDFHRISKIINLPNIFNASEAGINGGGLMKHNDNDNESTNLLSRKNSDDDITSVTFDIVKNPETFIELSLTALRNDRMIEELMYECLQRKRLLLREEYFRRQSEYLIHSKSQKGKPHHHGHHHHHRHPNHQQYTYLLDSNSNMPQMESFLEQMQFTMTEQSILFYYALKKVWNFLPAKFDQFRRLGNSMQNKNKSRELYESKDNNNDDEKEKEIVNELISIKDSLKLLWESDQIRSTFKKRHRWKFAFPDNIDYFFSRIDNVFDLRYSTRITPGDFLKSRLRTTGVTHQAIEYNKVKFDLFDVGGQRNERKKWIHSFDSVSAVLFVSALNHYCTVLFEDETTNAMIESINLFAETANSKWFRNTEIILFLNKDGKNVFFYC